jgi:hypothetical protein
VTDDKPHWMCRREGCSRPRSKKPGGAQMPCCSHACSYVRDEIDRMEKFARAGGTDPLAAEVWVAATTWNDALTELQTACRRLLTKLREAPPQ